MRASLSRALRQLAAISLCVLAALAQFACGGGDHAASTGSSSTVTSTSSTTTSTTVSGEPSELRRQFDELILDALTSAQGLTEKQARCAVEILDDEVSDAEIEAAAAEIQETGEAPGDLVDIAFDAGARCSTPSGG